MKLKITGFLNGNRSDGYEPSDKPEVQVASSGNSYVRAIFAGAIDKESNTFSENTVKAIYLPKEIGAQLAVGMELV